MMKSCEINQSDLQKLSKPGCYTQQVRSARMHRVDLFCLVIPLSVISISSIRIYSVRNVNPENQNPVPRVGILNRAGENV
jgi:hypothetical protein